MAKLHSNPKTWKVYSSTSSPFKSTQLSVFSMVSSMNSVLITNLFHMHTTEWRQKSNLIGKTSLNMIHMKSKVSDKKSIMHQIQPHKERKWERSNQIQWHQKPINLWVNLTKICKWHWNWVSKKLKERKQLRRHKYKNLERRSHLRSRIVLNLTLVWQMVLSNFRLISNQIMIVQTRINNKTMKWIFSTWIATNLQIITNNNNKKLSTLISKNLVVLKSNLHSINRSNNSSNNNKLIF